MGTKRTNPPKGDKQFLLENISSLDLRAWKKIASKIESYNIQLFYHLAGLRAIHADEIQDSLRQTKIETLSEQKWCRIVDFRFSDNPLSPKGSLIQGGRFNIGDDLDPSNFPSYPALYVAQDYKAAYAEKFTISNKNKSKIFQGHELALRTNQSFSSVAVNVEVKNIFDGTNANNLKPLVSVINKFSMPNELKELGKEIGRDAPWIINTPRQLKETLLADDWRSYPVQYDIPSNPQILGRLLFDAGFEGILYPSTKAARKKCIALFTDNFSGSNSFVELADIPHSGVKHTRLDQNNCLSIIND